MPLGTTFASRIDNQIYSFVTKENIVITAASGYTAANVGIFEGTYLTESFIVIPSFPKQQFVLSNPQVDTTSIFLDVQNSSSDNTSFEYTSTSTLFGFGPTSNIYFIQAASNGQYEVVFGDGIIGNQPVVGNIVNVTYRIASGTPANFANNFVLVGDVGGYTNVITSTIQAAIGGAPQESLDSIKFYAPKTYQTQNRAVVINDYRTLLMQEFPQIRAVNVYGGETIYPPQYGQVFVAVDIKNQTGVSDTQAASMQSFLSTKTMMIPNIVQPDYIYAVVNANVAYNINDTNSSTLDIQNDINSALLTFNNKYLIDFDVTLRQSLLEASLDNADESIVSTSTVIRYYKEIFPLANAPINSQFDYQNPIFQLHFQNVPNVESTPFTYANNPACFFQDDVAATGDLQICTIINGVKVVVLDKVGTIDYVNGIVTFNAGILTSNSITGYVGSQINLFVTSSTQNFQVTGSTILEIDLAQNDINVIAVRQ